MLHLPVASFLALPLDLMIPVFRRCSGGIFLESFPPFSFFLCPFSLWFSIPDALSLQHCQFRHLRTCAHPRAASIAKKVWNDSSPKYYRSCQIATASEIPFVSDLQRSVGSGRSHWRPRGPQGTGDINYNEAVWSVQGPCALNEDALITVRLNDYCKTISLNVLWCLIEIWLSLWIFEIIEKKKGKTFTSPLLLQSVGSRHQGQPVWFFFSFFLRHWQLLICEVLYEFMPVLHAHTFTHLINASQKCEN